MLTSVGSEQEQRSRCQRCDGLLYWEAEAYVFKCESCGETAAAESAATAESEQDLITALFDRRPLWQIGPQARESVCDDCGAAIEFATGVATASCAFCGSPSVLCRSARTDLIQPDAVVPFAVDREAAMATVGAWIDKRFGKRAAEVRDSVELFGVYVPHWLFSCKLTADWSAELIVDQGQHPHSEPIYGTEETAISEHQVCGSKTFSIHQGEESARFLPLAGAGYAAEYLQGFGAETYSVGIHDAWYIGQTEIEKLEAEAIRAKIDGEVTRVSLETEYHKSSFRLALLPMWFAHLRHRDKPYRYIVNGQSGAAGEPRRGKHELPFEIERGSASNPPSASSSQA